MVIYVEYVLLNNLAINALIIYLTLILTKRNKVWWRIALSALVGAVYALISPLIEFKGDIVLKIVLALIMCLVAVKPISVKKYFTLCTIFFLINFALGGTIMGLGYMYMPIMKAIYDKESLGIGLISAVSILSIFVVRKGINIFHKSRREETNVRKVIMTIDNGIVAETGYYDSGNTLYYKGIYPVIVVDEELGSKGKAVGKLRFSTVSGAGEKPVYKLNRLMIDNRTYESVYYIVNKLDGKYKVILHNDTF